MRSQPYPWPVHDAPMGLPAPHLNRLARAPGLLGRKHRAIQCAGGPFLAHLGVSCEHLAIPCSYFRKERSTTKMTDTLAPRDFASASPCATPPFPTHRSVRKYAGTSLPPIVGTTYRGFRRTFGMAVGEVDRHRNPLPAFGGDLFGFHFSLSVTRRSNKATSCKCPLLSCSNRSRKTPPSVMLFAVTRIGTSRPVGRFTIAEMIGLRFG
ncbi:hypothetical protein ACVISU_001859 [Bradyrhizobium sp. USDA 4452]